MKITPYRLLASFFAGISTLSALSCAAQAAWSTPTYNLTNRVPTNPNISTTAYQVMGGGGTTHINQPNGATISTTFSWTPDPNNLTPPPDVYVLQYGYATWNMSAPAAGLMSQPSFQEASFNPRRNNRLRLTQAQPGVGSANNGLGYCH